VNACTIRSNTIAVVLDAPELLALREVALSPVQDGDVVVEVEWSGISTGTERLLYSGRMPPFPGMGYPLVPGYEAVGRIAQCGRSVDRMPGERVFVAGSRGFSAVRGLFGAAAAHLVVPAARALAIGEGREEGVLLALAATARHALAYPGAAAPDLIVGHGVLGRLLARLALLSGAEPPTVWERSPVRAAGAEGYRVIDPAADDRRDYRCIIDASGDAGLLDTLIARLAPGGEIVLAGFYSEPLSFAFPPAFLREARIRVAAEWRPDDLVAVRDAMAAGSLSLEGLVTHRAPAGDAENAYRTAFGDPACLKMVLDWRELA
jgi:3-hydroxyethyl bacteriochlorophyllide a dehydrogenase